MYRTIDAAFWTDQKVRKLSPNERLLFLYLITNPHTHVSGLYYLPWLIAQHETGLQKADLDTAADTLSRLRVCRIDHENSLVWVVKMFRFQGKGQKNTLSAAHHLSKDCHNSLLIKEFIHEYPHVAPHINASLLDRVSRVGPPENGERRTENGAEDMGSTPPAEAPPPAPPPPQPTRTKKLPTEAPEELPITDQMREWAAKKQVTANLEEETEHMLDHHRAKGTKFKDWNAAWRTWMRNSKTFTTQRGNGNGARQHNQTQNAAGARPSREYRPKQ